MSKNYNNTKVYIFGYLCILILKFKFLKSNYQILKLILKDMFFFGFHVFYVSYAKGHKLCAHQAFLFIHFFWVRNREPKKKYGRRLI